MCALCMSDVPDLTLPGVCVHILLCAYVMLCRTVLAGSNLGAAVPVNKLFGCLRS